MQKNLLPVLLGADMNCYSVARAFHEEYGVRTQAFGRWAMGETKHSRIVNFTQVEDIDTDEVMCKTLLEFAKQTPGKTRVVLGCTDDYAALLIRNKDVLLGEYIVPCIKAELMDKLVSKDSFYKLCDEFDIQYPRTLALHPKEEIDYKNLPFTYPIIIKPSSSIEYWKNPFEGMNKVYTAKSAREAKAVTERIFAAGYSESIILQDMIPGPDDRMRVLTAYCDKNAKVRMMCLGNVLLEEHTPTARGNHAAILTEYNEPLMLKIKNFLEAIGYVGFANFDIKLDERDGSYRAFEINLRQGRSNYYVTGAGLNIAKYIVDDYVLNKPFEETLLYKDESFWHSIPADIVWKYTFDEELVRRAKAIVEAGKDTTTLGYKYDLRLNPLRWLYKKIHYKRYYAKYDTYCTKPER